MNCSAGSRMRRLLMLALALGWVPVARAQIEGQTVSGFRLPEYDEDGQLKQQLFGETATFLQDGIIKLTGLRLEIFSDGEVTARAFSPGCAYDSNRRRAASQEHIRIVARGAVVTGDGFAWNGDNEQFQIFRNAKVVLDAQMDRGLVEPRSSPPADPEPPDPE